MIIFIRIVMWYALIKMVEIASIKGNPFLLAFPILISYYIVVVQGIYLTDKNGD